MQVSPEPLTAGASKDPSPHVALFYPYQESRIVDNILDDGRLETHCPLDNGRHKIRIQKPCGRLDILPPELISSILISLDVPSLTRFRRVNDRAMCLVDSLWQYNAIVHHCPNIIRGILSINATAFSCSVLYATMHYNM
jgi:hypothetical protein